ncbi:hypothetical protein COCC4DRAFT_155203 [Bipolaris maydis ATCC 48331]|uniref:Uncharacterized protein n=2 Tax=Cochliobolus heterostrophus TaxID=5016 RepID=M2UC53_COCH5|nr:uncharacterized protein COCC4DRAFT_155203 [Bipolaris maydis ATCC 48331]EMD91266.1 hypothetical protein COCHEDRAFT_1101487 [Bipolaris maydis C5]KAJ5027013.1 hypothetical protein J3E73DRAFT_187500 [Bipolaris maydis]ENH98674.1 hypothetical protein COCC4DRAFT_155203 [Bipolaris maydis ATCC 48331]KAJ5051306.1 hypothetical protein J3E74DRAFT_229716 [Bipolaris maydis]KAJ5059227.1 hypothetical protein J3E74DRAFT_429906 [Bipolaris maydis]
MRPKKIKWAPLEDGTEDNEAHLLSAEEDDGLRARLRAREKPRLSVIKVIIFTLWTVAAFAVGHFTDPSWREAKWGSFENGFVEERVVAPADIFELTQTVFTGGVDFTPDGEEILGPSLYVGEPSPEIDAAWDAIIGGRTHYFSISKEEAVALWGKDAHRYKDRPQGGFTGTLDLFHCLHCLNQLRKALRRDIYPEEKYRGMVHQYHCIDHLRQVIQCQATSVISPTEWHEHRGQYVAPKQLHTCRNFEKIQQFSQARWNGTIAKPRFPH